ALESHADSSCRCVTPLPTAQLFLLRVPHAHGLARFARKQRRDRPQPCLVFAAEAAAQVRADHPHLVVSQPKDPREFVTIAVDIWTRLPHGELISIPSGEAVARLQRERARGLCTVGSFND